MVRNYLSGSIKKGLEIIECIGKSPKPLKASQVSSITNLDRATTFRILTYLTSLGYIFKDTKNSSVNASYIARLVENVPSSANFERYTTYFSCFFFVIIYAFK